MRSLVPISITLTLAALAGCATTPPPQTIADLSRANTLIGAAEQGGAQQYAAADLQAARDEVQQATQLENSNPVRADELANEAAVDAKLASARVQNAQARHGVRQLHETLNTLRSEEHRNMNSPDTQAAPSDMPQSQPPSQDTPPLNQEPPPGSGNPLE